MRIGVALLVFAACKPAAGPAVAFLTATPHDQDVASFQRRAAQHDVSIVALSADDAAGQRAQVEDVLARGVQVIVVEPADANVAAGYVRLAHDHGAKVVAYDRPIASSELDFYVAHDSYRVGVLEAEAALEATGHRGRYVLLASAADTMRGYENTLAPYIARGDLEIAVKRDATSFEQARRTIADGLAGGAIDAVLATGSGPTRGAVEAIAAAGLSHVFVAGAGTVDDGCHAPQSVEVVEDARLLATTAADVAMRLLDGEVNTDATIELAGNHIPAAEVRVELVACKRAVAVAR